MLERGVMICFFLVAATGVLSLAQEGKSIVYSPIELLMIDI